MTPGRRLAAAATTLALPSAAPGVDRAAYAETRLALVLVSSGVLVIPAWARQGRLAVRVEAGAAQLRLRAGSH